MVVHQISFPQDNPKKRLNEFANCHWPPSEMDSSVNEYIYIMIGIRLLALFSIFFLFTSCFHPVTTMFETAYSLDPEEVKLSFAASANPESDSSPSGVGITAIVDQGVTPTMDMRFRVERRIESDVFGAPYTFAEIAPKWSNRNGKGFAFALPLQVYAVDDDAAYVFTDPRFIFTHRPTEGQFELTGILRSQMGFVEGGFGFIPGASLGLGYSKDWNQQAFRFEMGFISGAVTYGLGVQTKLGKSR
jgi:hypothetical protein